LVRAFFFNLKPTNDAQHGKNAPADHKFENTGKNKKATQ
jgi:hypothetical protein